MKQKLIIALLLNLAFLLFSGYIFISKGIAKDFVFWKFSASLLAVIVFGFLVIMILKQLRQYH